jgi:hypothetical protein
MSFRYYLFFLLSIFPLVGPASYGQSQPGLKIATFDVDATPPVGSNLTYNPMINSWDLGLRAKGIVITGAGQPIVLCVVDWIEITNEGQDVFKKALAEAAGTIPQRVAVHTVHQHDAPICDFTAERLLKEAGLNPLAFEGTFARKVIGNIQNAIREASVKSQPVTHIGLGKAEVKMVASNRRIMGADGKVIATRYTATKDSALRAQPEGLIDPEVSLISFWNEDKPIAVLSYYATHPQSYYLTGVANPDFPGIARFYRQLAVPDALHIHFNGAGGNIGAGKYNDGSKENRGILAERLADGMKRAWEATTRVPLSPSSIKWAIEPVRIPVSKYLEGEVQKVREQMKANNMPLLYTSNNMMRVGFLERSKAGKTIDIECLSAGKARILFLPGELFVEYQLAAKKLRPDLFVAMAAYGDCSPGYIGTAASYGEGGYEAGPASSVAPEVEGVLMNAIKKLLK